jgi:hypothetical protein
MVLAPLGIELAVWVIAFGVLIFCILCVYITKAFFGVAGGTLGKLPVIGGWINSGIHSVEQRVVHVMSAAAAGAQSIAGAALHTLAREVDWIGREIRNHSNLLALLATLSLGAAQPWELQLLVRELRKLIRGNAGTASHAIHRLGNVEKRLEHGIGEDVLPRIRGVEREIDRVLDHDIASLRRRARTLDREYERLWKWTRVNTRAWGTLAFAGAVAFALSRLKVGWIRCPKLAKRGPALCNLDDALFAALLADSLLIVGSLSLVEFAREMVDVTDTAVRPITTFWRAS